MKARETAGGENGGEERWRKLANTSRPPRAIREKWGKLGKKSGEMQQVGESRRNAGEGLIFSLWRRK